MVPGLYFENYYIRQFPEIVMNMVLALYFKSYCIYIHFLLFANGIWSTLGAVIKPQLIYIGKAQKTMPHSKTAFFVFQKKPKNYNVDHPLNCDIHPPPFYGKFPKKVQRTTPQCNEYLAS